MIEEQQKESPENTIIEVQIQQRSGDCRSGWEKGCVCVCVWESVCVCVFLRLEERVIF